MDAQARLGNIYAEGSADAKGGPSLDVRKGMKVLQLKVLNTRECRKDLQGQAAMVEHKSCVIKHVEDRSPEQKTTVASDAGLGKT